MQFTPEPENPEEEARFRAAVREGIAQADQGHFIEEDEMEARLQQMLES